MDLEYNFRFCIALCMKWIIMGFFFNCAEFFFTLLWTSQMVLTSNYSFTQCLNINDINLERLIYFLSSPFHIVFITCNFFQVVFLQFHQDLHIILIHIGHLLRSIHLLENLKIWNVLLMLVRIWHFCKINYHLLYVFFWRPFRTHPVYFKHFLSPYIQIR